MEIKVVDFEDWHAAEVDAIDSAEWWHVPILETQASGRVIKVALDGDDVVGVTYGRVRGDLFICEVCLVKDGYRGCGVGTMLSKSLVQAAVELGCRNASAEVLVRDGKMNAAGLMEKFGFRELFRVKGYWRGESDRAGACPVCGKKPCECVCVYFIKELE